MKQWNEASNAPLGPATPSSPRLSKAKVTALYVIIINLLVVQMLLLASCNFDDADVSFLHAHHMASNLPQSNVILRLALPPSNPAFQPDIEIYSSKRLFQDMPQGHRKTFFSHSSMICHVMIRALRQLGWTRVNNREDAQLIWTYTRMKNWYPKLETWQRYNHIPRTYVWNHKDKFAQGFRQYQERTSTLR